MQEPQVQRKGVIGVILCGQAVPVISLYLWCAAGTAAIQVAKQIGTKIFTTAGSQEKLDFAKELGASTLINYKEQDFVEIVLKETQGPELKASSVYQFAMMLCISVRSIAQSVADRYAAPLATPMCTKDQELFFPGRHAFIVFMHILRCLSLSCAAYVTASFQLQTLQPWVLCTAVHTQ